MPASKIFRTVRPYISALAVMIVIGMLVFTIYFTELGLQWVTFLTGVLIASILALVSRSSRAEWIITRRTAQLRSLKDKLDQETQLRNNADTQYQQTLTRLQQTEQAFARLIPHQLLSLLERDSIVDVKLGDQVERKLTIMFSDIRHFTSLSESMTPQENFTFLNSYLNQIEPVIGMHRGIIDKYMGDAIMALFTQGADDAVSGAIHMIEKLDEYNAGRARAGYMPIQIGFGLNTGLVMIGTVGGTNRMESTVIGDAVNLTSRIEEATKTYHIPLLISQNTLYDLANPAKYDIRFLDRIRVKGKTQPLSIYEVFDNDPIKIRDSKRVTKSKFEEAIAHYHMGEVPRAMELLAECLEITPKDVPARIYMARCEEYLASGQHHTTGELNNHLEWREEFQIGIEEIDAAHKLLFGKINELISILTQGNYQPVRDTFAYIASHHMMSENDEEELMRQYNYPFFDTHLQEHKRFIDNFMALKEEADEGSCELSYLSFRVQLLLFDWFTGHIAKTDRHLGRYLQQIMQMPAPAQNLYGITQH
ncbi:MAG: guanylate cyclase [Gammaproteobacteria bacterium]|nr:guanylate cyclase [Gammaproteobacteria bacterium]MBU1447262.1 guanylate cyclase [Gammaproteobacteria bacterium]MDD2928620.1 adenylate/guanylate cyclase domain-containing protein [Sideroxydans sp.]